MSELRSGLYPVHLTTRPCCEEARMAYTNTRRVDISPPSGIRMAFCVSRHGYCRL